jgi:hypothetical protein
MNAVWYRYYESFSKQEYYSHGTLSVDILFEEINRVADRYSLSTDPDPAFPKSFGS